ncbi:hypothetical protein ASE92_07665 [Pedobacter sp. Leaf41]|uniref:hypothetical protein n=1 Tax=Pedobacter sp. Leaf41 TaxID=1736218 RepID=UPI00070311DB|nr:hypothetical protein [Pedobacter sp. Leaf41]KQN36006.1 hypothetical protein ASE92_07665 [Pedobacter sp. Leaf41]
MKTEVSDQNIESLKKQRNLMKGVAIGYALVMTVAISLALYLTFTRQNAYLLAIVPVCLIVMIPILMRVSQLNTAIKNRHN